MTSLAIPKRLRSTLAAAALVLTAAGSTAAQGRPHFLAPTSSAALDVQPFPGTPDASPQTDIGFPELAPSQIETLAVTGSRSGAHRGRLVALPTGRGSEFIPARPFTDGEHVRVLATLRARVAGAASVAPGANRLGWSFSVAAPIPLGASAGRMPIARQARVNWNRLTHSFHSESWLHPPIVGVTGTDPDPNVGDIFADAENSLQPGPVILNPDGQLLYFQPLKHSKAFNVQVQTYQGQSVLTYWQGYSKYGVGIGHDVVLNHNYQQVAAVYAGHGYNADLHEFQITPSGNAFITAFVPVRANLSSVGGPRHGILLDAVIQEINISTGQVLWEWHASGHIHLSETYEQPLGNAPFDCFHVNSIQQLPNGNLLISARHTWALYEINMRTGRIPLVIGGKHSSVRMGPGTHFEWQHNARMQPDGTITVFDNASNGGSREEYQSRALRLRLNLRRRRVTLVRAFTDNPPLLAASQGSVQPLPDGNTFVGWGAVPYFTEFGPTGRQLFSLHFGPRLESYRGLRFQWWGQPATPPWVAVSATTDGTNVYASWNGATQVASWRVLSGPSTSSMATAGQYAKTSFETKMAVGSTQPYFAVQALDGAGNVLGTSVTVVRPG
jgi:arylsulfotransferase ASST